MTNVPSTHSGLADPYLDARPAVALDHRPGGNRTYRDLRERLLRSLTDSHTASPYDLLWLEGGECQPSPALASLLSDVNATISRTFRFVSQMDGLTGAEERALLRLLARLRSRQGIWNRAHQWK